MTTNKRETVTIPATHEDAAAFHESVNFTAGHTGFSQILIEKDYLCTVLLTYLDNHSNDELIFKGGTSLAKVFFDFYRLSEDLDFIIPMPLDATRKQRSNRVTHLKKAIDELPKQVPFLHLVEPLKGANNSRQYLATIGYKSLVDGRSETIELEIGLREPLLEECVIRDANTLLQSAATSKHEVIPLQVKCLSVKEAMAEKFRAALSRQDVAIRDFYDIDYAMVHKNFKAQDKDFIEMVRKKLAIPDNDPPDVSKDRIAGLSDQIEARLKPVLRPKDYEAFNLDRAIKHVVEAHSRL